MSASRKAKKYAPNRRHWHSRHTHFSWGIRDGVYWAEDVVCYQSHRSKLDDSRRRRVESTMRRVNRKNPPVSRYGKMTINRFYNVSMDASNFVAAIKRAMASINSLSIYWGNVQPIMYKEVHSEESEAAREQDRESAQRREQTPVEPAASCGKLEKEGDSERSGKSVGA